MSLQIRGIANQLKEKKIWVRRPDTYRYTILEHIVPQ
jgi:hypothetical protein